MSTRRTLAVSAGVLVALALPAAASAATYDSPTPQLVEATGAPSLGLTIPATPVAAAALTHGDDRPFTPTEIGVVSPLGTWSLTVSDATNAGKLKAAAVGCTGSDPYLDNELEFTSTTTLASTPVLGSGEVLDTAQTVISNAASLADTVTINYKVDVPQTQQLKTGCLYGTQLAYSITG